MPGREAKRATAQAKARALLATMTEQESRAVQKAALADPDARPLDQRRLRRMRPMSASDSAELQKRLRGRPPWDAPKRLVSLRLDPDVVERFRATGPGWQSRINQVLREHLP
jgi:uncharacterized protein (DUF4415 family)